MSISKKKEEQIVREIMDGKGEKGSGQSFMENLVAEMWEDARKKGYDSLKDYLAHHFKKWDEETEAALMYELYESFWEAVQRGEFHRNEDEVWNIKNVFEEWLEKSKENLHRRLLELDEDYETKQPSFSSYIDLFPEMTDLQGNVGNAIDVESYDFYKMLMRKTLETVNKLLKNTTLIEKLLRERDEIFKGEASDA